MRTPPKTLVSGVDDVIPTQGWQARAICIDNPGGQWVLLPDQEATIPPWTGGAVVPCPTGTQQVRVSTIAPTTQVNSLRGNPAVVYLTDEPLPASSGSAYAQNLLTSELTVQDSGGGTFPPLAGQVLNLGFFGLVTVPIQIVRVEIQVLPAIAAENAVNVEWVLSMGTEVLAIGQGAAGASAAAVAVQPVTDMWRQFVPPLLVNPASPAAQLALVVTRHDGATTWAANAMYGRALITQQTVAQ